MYDLGDQHLPAVLYSNANFSKPTLYRCGLVFGGSRLNVVVNAESPEEARFHEIETDRFHLIAARVTHRMHQEREKLNVCAFFNTNPKGIASANLTALSPLT